MHEDDTAPRVSAVGGDEPDLNSAPATTRNDWAAVFPRPDVAWLESKVGFRPETIALLAAARNLKSNPVWEQPTPLPRQTARLGWGITPDVPVSYSVSAEPTAGPEPGAGVFAQALLSSGGGTSGAHPNAGTTSGIFTRAMAGMGAERVERLCAPTTALVVVQPRRGTVVEKGSSSAAKPQPETQDCVADKTRLDLWSHGVAGCGVDSSSEDDSVGDKSEPDSAGFSDGESSDCGDPKANSVLASSLILVR